MQAGVYSGLTGCVAYPRLGVGYTLKYLPALPHHHSGARFLQEQCMKQCTWGGSVPDLRTTQAVRSTTKPQLSAHLA